MDFIEFFLCWVGLISLAKMCDQYFGKNVTRILVVLMLGFMFATDLCTERFIWAGVEFVCLCGYVLLASESEPDDPDDEDEEP